MDSYKQDGLEVVGKRLDCYIIPEYAVNFSCSIAPEPRNGLTFLIDIYYRKSIENLIVR